MKKILTAVAFLISANSFAATFWAHGVLMGTVCRNGAFFTAYPLHMAQPVGSSCPLRDGFGNVIGYGSVTAE